MSCLRRLPLCFALALVPVSAGAQQQAPDPLRDCEALALAQSKSEGGTLSAIRIERGDSLIENRYDRKVGSQFVATEYIAWATIEDGQGKRRARILCLHAGAPKGKAVYLIEWPR